MKGYIMKYKPYNDKARTWFNHVLFGRLVFRNYRGRHYAYYVPGMLDDKLYTRLLPSKIFLETVTGLDMDTLNNYCDIEIEEATRDNIMFKTANDHWRAIAKEKGCPVRVRRKTRV